MSVGVTTTSASETALGVASGGGLEGGEGQAHMRLDNHNQLEVGFVFGRQNNIVTFTSNGIEDF
jgi:hypothetical protein